MVAETAAAETAAVVARVLGAMAAVVKGVKITVEETAAVETAAVETAVVAMMEAVKAVVAREVGERAAVAKGAEMAVDETVAAETAAAETAAVAVEVGGGEGGDEGHGVRACAHHAQRASTHTTQLERSGGRARDRCARGWQAGSADLTEGRRRRVALAGAYLHFRRRCGRGRGSSPSRPAQTTAARPRLVAAANARL